MNLLLDNNRPPVLGMILQGRRPSLADLPGKLFDWNPASASTFRAANFPLNNTVTAKKYFTASDQSFLSTITALSAVVTFDLDAGADHAGNYQILTAWDDVANNQNVFYWCVQSNPNKAQQVYIANAKTDGGSNGAKGTQSCNVVNTRQRFFTRGFVYNGGLTGNSNRLKLYGAGGALDAGTTFDGTIPAAFTNGTAPLLLGRRGSLSTQYFCGPMLKLWLWVGTALSDAQMALVMPATRNGNPSYSVTVPTGITNPTHGWNLDESSSGTRQPAFGAVTFAESNGSIPATTYMKVTDGFGSGDVAISVATLGSHSVTIPTLTTGPNGLPAVDFSADADHGCNFRFNSMGLTSNPTECTMVSLVKLKDSDMTYPKPIEFYGSEINGGADGNNISTNCWGYVEGPDFATSNCFSSAYGDGAGATAAAHSAAGTISAYLQTWFVLTSKKTAGDNRIRVWVNGTEITMTPVIGNVSYPVFTDVPNQGGTFQGYRLGQLGDWDELAFHDGSRMQFARHIALSAALTPAQQKWLEKAVGGPAGIQIS